MYFVLVNQVSLNPENMAPNHYPASGSEGMPSFATTEKTDMPNDPYEMTFNDEPPPKLKRRTPKEPKEPKPKKPPKSPKTPKEPKPKKPRKGKNAAAASEQIPNTEGQPGTMPMVVSSIPMVNFL